MGKCCGAREKKRAMALDAEDLSKVEDLWAKLPDEVQQKIFKLLRWRQLFRVCVVSKSFNEGINRYVHDLPLFRTAVPISTDDINPGFMSKISRGVGSVCRENPPGKVP
jgi:hypothetical protein